MKLSPVQLNFCRWNGWMMSEETADRWVEDKWMFKWREGLTDGWAV